MNATIVAAISGTRSTEALALGRRLADLLGADLVLAHVVARPRATDATHPHDEGLAVLGAARAQLPPGARVETVPLLDASPARALHRLALARGARLLVLGPPRRARAGRTALGPVSEQVVHGAPCAVALAPDGWDEAAADSGAAWTIGVADDGRPEAREAVRLATALAGDGGRDRVRRWTASDDFGAGPGVRVAAVRDSGAPPAIVHGNPGPTLVRAAEEDDVELMVCGSRGYGPPRAVLLGDVAAHLAAHADRPLVIAPRAGGRRATWAAPRRASDWPATQGRTRRARPAGHPPAPGRPAVAGVSYGPLNDRSSRAAQEPDGRAAVTIARAPDEIPGDADALGALLAHATGADAVTVEPDGRIETTQRPGLLVLASESGATPGRVHPTDAARRLVDGAACAVAFAPAGYAQAVGADLRTSGLDGTPAAYAQGAVTRTDLHTIGVGFDGTPESLAALQAAARLARATGATLVAIGVLGPRIELLVPRTVAAVEYGDYEASVRPRRQQALHDALEPLDHPSTKAEATEGDPLAQLTARSHALDLLVLGSRSYGPAARTMLGSVSVRIVRQAACPVLIVPRPLDQRAIAADREERPIAATASD